MIRLFKSKPIKVYKWVQKRYNYYDEIEGHYVGDMYVDKVLVEASKKFKLAPDEIEKVYNIGMNEFLEIGQKKSERIQNKKRKYGGSRNVRTMYSSWIATLYCFIVLLIIFKLVNIVPIEVLFGAIPVSIIGIISLRIDRKNY